MTLSALTLEEEAFRSAVEAGDFTRAEAALQNYVMQFQAERRTLQEVASARDLFKWSVQVTQANQANMASELMLVTKVSTGYVPPRRRRTWSLDV